MSDSLMVIHKRQWLAAKMMVCIFQNITIKHAFIHLFIFYSNLCFYSYFVPKVMPEPSTPWEMATFIREGTGEQLCYTNITTWLRPGLSTGLFPGGGGQKDGQYRGQHLPPPEKLLQVIWQFLHLLWTRPAAPEMEDDHGWHQGRIKDSRRSGA